MPIQGIRIEIVILALLLALAGFFGGQYLIREYFIGQPLQEELLAIEGVIDLEFIDSRERTLLFVELAPVPNLLLTYQEIQEVSSNLVKSREHGIQIRNRNQELEDVFYQLHYHIYHLLAREDFLALKEYLEREKIEQGLSEATFFLDDAYLYLQLIAGEETYYRLIPRKEM